MNSFFPNKQNHNKLKLEDFNNNNSNKYSSMKNIIIKNIDYKDDKSTPTLYKNSFINQNKDIRRLLHLSLMEFIKKNYKHKSDSIISLRNIKNNNYLNNPNIKFLFPGMKNKLSKKLIANYFTQNNNLFNKTNKNLEHELSTERKNSIFGYQYKNSSFINDLYNNKNITEKKKINSKNRVNSTGERNSINNIKLFGKNKFEENNLVIDFEFPMSKNEFSNNNIVYIRKKNKNIHINDYNNNIPYLNREPLLQEKLQKNIEKFEEEKIFNQKNGKNPLLKKNQSLPDINTERKESKHSKIKSSYIPNDINRRINSQKNENFFKDYTFYLNEKKKKPKKVFEYIYDNNINAEFHFLSIKFGIGNQKKNKYQMYNNYNNYTNNINTKENEEIIVKAYKKELFLNKELSNKNNIKNIKNNYSNRNNYGYNKTSVSRKSTEENKNNLSNKKSNDKDKNNLNEKDNKSNNNLNKKNEMKNFYKSKYNKFDIKKSILSFNKKDNEKNDSEKNLLNKQDKKCKDKLFNIENGFHNFKNNKNIEQTPLIINRYNYKRKKNNNDDIIGLI